MMSDPEKMQSIFNNSFIRRILSNPQLFRQMMAVAASQGMAMDVGVIDMVVTYLFVQLVSTAAMYCVMCT
jgi:hypothetical protein